MEQLLDIQTLIWLFPILFIFHDFEEIIMMEKWLNKYSNVIYEKLPKKMADKVIKQFSMSTAQFAVAVLIIFLLVSGSTIMAIQYLNDSPFGNIYIFTIVMLTFFLHAFTHIGQSLLFHSITPGAFTSIIIVIPYSLVLFHTLLAHEIITWNIIFICLPFILLFIPIALFSHWVGRRVG
ncbi:HXXEE domain-containing protein [Robertmurraya andreesenii]|uniref:HXXEE domain-containing protein n=1 Tax=Anoxybacillus andreesenii TaxID=1325932 RepID=UPI0027D7A473|nr:HXXEE domain-containing protein [Robertmurraya andreesenii]